MIINYLKIALINLIKNRVYSLISISGLSIGLAVCILLYLYVSNEFSYDRYHEKSDNIYRLCQEEHPYHAPGTAKFLAENLPEIINYARIFPRDNIIVKHKNQQYKEDYVAWVDAELMEIFSFEFIRGNPMTSLQQPGTAIITEKTALKYFGDKNAVGRILKVDNQYDYTIVGVIKDIPQNSHFTFDFFLSLADGEKMFGKDWMSDWGWLNFLVYFEMQDQFLKADIETKISKLMKDLNNSDGPFTRYTVQSLKDIHLYSSNFLNDIQAQNSISFVLIFSAIGILILLIAGFNYVNLFTANATKRVTEIGVRKTFGATRTQLAVQYISESIIVFFISFLISLILIQLSLHLFNELSGKILAFSIFSKPALLLSLIAIILVAGIIAGWYPAIILASYSPTKVMKSNNKGSGLQFKKILVGAQFTIVIILIACALFMFRQISFLKNKDLGFDQEAVLFAEFDFGNEAKYNTLKQALLKQNFVSNVSAASRIPSGELNNSSYVLPEGKEEAILIPHVHVDFNYFRTLGIKPIQGRLFSENFKTDSTESIILNKAAVAELGLNGNPVGQILKCAWPKSTRKVIGIIDDINFESLYNNIKPAVFIIFYPMNSRLIIKLKSSDLIRSKDAVTEISQSIYPNELIEYNFLYTKLEQNYMKDYKTFQLMGFFAVLAVFLACMGLFGIASFMMTNRTKEIGVRKVNGATISEIMKMLNVSFIKWIVVAFVIATPIVYYSIHRWLEIFAFKIELNWWVFLLAGIISLVIVLVTVSGLTYRAARRNPVESLRYE